MTNTGVASVLSPILVLHEKLETFKEIQESCDPFKNSQIVFFVYIIQGWSHIPSKGEVDVCCTSVVIMLSTYWVSQFSIYRLQQYITHFVDTIQRQTLQIVV